MGERVSHCRLHLFSGADIEFHLLVVCFGHSIVLVSILQKDNLQERIHRSCQVTLQVPPLPEPMCHHAGTTGTMHKVAWSHFRHAVYTRIHVYASGHEKVSSGNLRSGTLANKTPAHWPRPTENWWSDPQSELLDWQNPETGPKLSADPRSTVFFKSANPLDLSPKSTIRELFNPLSPNSDQHQFSLNNIHTMSRDEVMRRNKMIT